MSERPQPDRSLGHIGRLLDRVSDVVVARQGLLLIGALVLTVASVWIILERFDIRSGIKDLMPASSRSVSDITTITERIGSITSLEIIVEAPEGEAPLSEAGRESEAYRACMARAEETEDEEHRCEDGLVIFAHALAEELAELESIGFIHFHNDRTFFESHGLLYATPEELEELYEEIDAELDDARRRTGEYKACLVTALDPSSCEAIRTGEGEGEGEGEERSMKERFEERMEDSEIGFYGEYFESTLADGARILKLKVRFRDPSTSLKKTREHLDSVDAVIAGLDPDSFSPGMFVSYGGGFKSQSDDYQSIQNDIAMSAGATIGGIFLLMILFFRRLRVVLIIMLPLVMSVTWTLALAFLLVGYLNLITAFIFAVLLGLGIDFGIHILARYDEERSRGHTPEGAMREALVEVGSANLSGGLTTAATFFALMLADFEGFAQFGEVAGIGVLMSLLAMLTVMPAFALLGQRLRPVPARGAGPGQHSPPLTGSRRLTGAAAVILIVALGAASYFALSAPQIPFEENFYRLQMRPPEGAEEERDRYAGTNKRHSSPAIALLDSLEEVHALELLMEDRRDPQRVYRMRRFAYFYPNTLGFLQDTFGTAMAWSPWGGWTSMAFFTDVLTPEVKLSAPFYQSYDPARSPELPRIHAFVEAYPGFSRALSETLLRGPLASHDVYGAIGPVSRMSRWVPESYQDLLPTRFTSRDIHTLQSFVSIFSFMPGSEAEQRERIEIIEKIRKRTRPRRIRFLQPEERTDIEELYPYLVSEPITIEDLPDWVKQQFKEAGLEPAPPRPGSVVDYAYGNFAILYQNTSSKDGLQARQFTDEVRSLHVQGKPLKVSANAIVFADILVQIKKDGALLIAVVLIAVFLVILIQARSLLRALVIMSPLLFGMAFMIGFMIALDIRIGFFNMVVIPMVVGIGIDDGVHLFHRYRAEGRGGILQAVRHTGGSIAMTSATTAVGFAGMLLSRHMGLNTMGELAIIGIGCALFATLLIQPALLVLAERLGSRAIVPERTYRSGEP